MSHALSASAICLHTAVIDGAELPIGVMLHGRFADEAQKVLKGLEDRDQVLSKLEPEVERLVLDDNYWQSFVISLDRIAPR